MVAAKVWTGSAWEYVGGAITAAVQPGAPSGPAVGQLWLDTDELAQGQGNGPYVCTSTTRPTSPTAGMEIYETDTNRLYIYTGTAWYYESGGTDPTAARAYAGAATALTNGAFTTIGFNTESYDYGNNFAANTYTCPRAGLLSASAGALVGTTTAGMRLVGSIFLNGQEAARGTDISATAGNSSAHVSTEHLVAVGDQITFRVWVNAASQSTITGSNFTYMTCRMLP